MFWYINSSVYLPGCDVALALFLHTIPSGIQILRQNVAYLSINSSIPGQNDRHFADDIFECIFMNEKFDISIRISLKFIPEGSIDNKWALVQVMTWRRTGDKPLPEPMLAHFTDAYTRHSGEMS